MKNTAVSRGVRAAAVAGLAGVCFLPSAFAASASDDVEAQARESWREVMIHTAVPEEGCFHAAYPDASWTKVACTKAPDQVYLPRASTGATADTVGNGLDYAAEVAGVMNSATGSFPSVTGVTRERDRLAQNVYSLQLNSNFMSTAACDGVRGCLSWEQFVYSSSSRSAFMQYWLINYGSTCPSGGWISYSGSCYKNSAAVSVPKIAITQLANLKLAASAVANGNDTLVFTTATDAYSTSGKDSVVYLATDWNQSEFNIVGDGGGSRAVFNTGSSITVKVTVNDGTGNAPSCASRAGTTGETNNLTLQSCSASGGSSPAIQFVESN